MAEAEIAKNKNLNFFLSSAWQLWPEEQSFLK